MRRVFVAGVGQTRVGRRVECSLRDLAREAVLAALAEAEQQRADAIVVGNMLAGELCCQSNLACLIADVGGMTGVEAIRVEAACGSGGAALRMGTLMIGSGAYDSVLVVGVEKMTDKPSEDVTAALASAGDADYEALHQASFAVLNGLIMQRYLHEYHYSRDDFAGFTINAHRNALSNPMAMFRREVTSKEFADSPPVSTPIHVLDCSPICDGAAAALLVSDQHPLATRTPAVRIAASAGSTDSIALITRRRLAWLDGAERSAKAAYAQAGLGPRDIDLFELHDAFTIIAALSLEAAGFVEPGQGVRFGSEQHIGLRGDIPISTMGGLKARGHPVGASGVYQLGEACMQLRGTATANQVDGARIAMCQSIGGSGASVFTHI
ncbi:MAG: thiolase C-terminal domain-containing protein, partial [Myxococcales bacterium]